MDNRIRPLLQRYADFDFRIDTQEWAVRFSRTVNGEVIDNIKVSRGEENLFVWCFFLAVMRLAMDPEIEAYRWVKYVYIDDPISSLDEHNAISVGNHLAQLLNKADNPLKVVISSHHPLFFNVMYNELDARKSKKVSAHFLSRSKADGSYTLGHIDTVIGLPANLFFSTGIPVCILVLKKCKKPDDVLFINAAEEYDKAKRQNVLQPEHINKIIDTYQFRKEEERYSRRVSMEEIERNDFNLNISRYVSTAEAEKEIDLDAVHAELTTLDKTIKAATKRHNDFLRQLGLPLLP